MNTRPAQFLHFCGYEDTSNNVYDGAFSPTRVLVAVQECCHSWFNQCLPNHPFCTKMYKNVQKSTKIPKNSNFRSKSNSKSQEKPGIFSFLVPITFWHSYHIKTLGAETGKAYFRKKLGTNPQIPGFHPTLLPYRGTPAFPRKVRAAFKKKTHLQCWR